MRHQNTVFHNVLKLLPWPLINSLVRKHGMDFGVRRLDTKTQLIAMLFGQLSDCVGLRHLITSLKSHRGLVYHWGAKEVRRSTLADANRDRPCEFFEGLFAALLKHLPMGLPSQTRQAVRLMDSTSIKLNALSSAWARFSKGVFGAKLHVLYDPDFDRPIYYAFTKANVNDITPAKTIEIEAGATYVIDLGYYDFGWWAVLDAEGCRIVSRLKKNTPLKIVAENKVPKGTNILSDRIGHLPDRLCYSRRNPFQDPVREIRVRTDTGKILRLFTNDLDAPAQEIADLYKERWQIELLFRWIKQTLKIKKFLGTSENAVRIQIAVALIAFLLLRAGQRLYGITDSPLEYARLIRANLTHRRPIRELHDPPPPKAAPSSPQLLMEFAKC